MRLIIDSHLDLSWKALSWNRDLTLSVEEIRRAEREMTSLAEHETVNAAAIRYANRLSDHLFVAARAANDWGARDVLWQPGANR